METNDSTLLEMQQQMQQLREKLDSQKIVNERILRRSCGRTIDRLRIKSNAPIVAGLAGLALIPFLHHLGFSPLLLIVTGVFMIAGIVATLITKQYIPNLNKDLVTATTELTKFRKINADWYKYGVPFLLVWLGILIWDVVKNLQLGGPELYGFICGSAIGLVVGLAWMGAALIYLFVKSPWKRGVIGAVILVGYWLLLRFVSAPDVPGSDPLSLKDNLVGWVDRLLLPGKLLYTSAQFDPEGLLSTLPAIVTALLGMFAGDLVRLPEETMTGKRKTLWLQAAAAACLAIGLLWSLDFPVNKKLWSSSFVLVVAAYSFACFALFYYLIDVKGYRKWSFPLKVIGMNSITIYLLQKIVSIPSINRFFLGGLAGLFSASGEKVVFAVGYVLICWLILYFLYKKEVFLKV